MERVELIYITSLGASGSTLLDLLISSHSRVVSVGEIVNLSDLANLRRTDRKVHALGNECTCGARTIFECPFWTRVDETIRSRSGLGLRDLELRTRNTENFGRDNRLLFEAVAEVSGTNVIVDSSKDPQRLKAMIDADFAKIRAIHLFRDPRAMINSRLRLGMKLPRMVALFNYRTLQIRRTVGHIDSMVLRYADLTRDPEGAMRRVMSFVGLPFEQEQLQWAGRDRHNIGGNRMRRTTDSTIREDTKWKTELHPWQKLAISALTLPARLITPS